MNPLLYYILQVMAASGILYLYYYIALRNKRFHQYNRFYLLAAMLLSIFIPFLNIPVYFTQQETSTSIVLQTLTAISGPAGNETVSAIPAGTTLPYSFTMIDFLAGAYIIVISLALIRIIVSLYRIRKISRRYPVEKIGDINFVNTQEAGTPFSFFRWLFWDHSININSQNGERIFRHELFHIREKHTLDILFTELLAAIFWINPVFHLVKKEIRAIHEFLADRHAVQETDKWSYAELLLMHTLRTKQSLVNPFFYNQVKRRIAMITNPQKTSHQYLRKMLVLPLAAVVVSLFAFKYRNAGGDPVVPSANPITVVIDAGHGGTDPGVKSPDMKYNEAAVSLELAKAVQSLSSSYNVKVIMTREDEHFPGNATTKNDGLKKRVDISSEAKPDMFISLHLNTSEATNYQDEFSGIEAYVAGKRKDNKGEMLASSILQELSPVYKTNTEFKSREQSSVWVLDQNTCPAVLLECGYINNRNDLSFFTDKSNQEKIAKSILQGIVNYKANASVASVSTEVERSTDFSLSRNVVFFAGNKIILQADSVTVHDKSAASVGLEVLNYLVVLDGKVQEQGFLQKNTSVGGIVEIWAKADPEAIRLYGQKAAQGLIVINNSEIINQPPSEYYKTVLDKLEADKKKSKAVAPIVNPQQTTIKLPEVVYIAYLPTGKQAEPSSTIKSDAPLMTPGSKDWKRYFERNLDPYPTPAKAGIYRVAINFIADREGVVSAVKIITDKNAELAPYLKELISHIPKVSASPEQAAKGKVSYSQPIVFQVIDQTLTAQGKKIPTVIYKAAD